MADKELIYSIKLEGTELSNEKTTSLSKAIKELTDEKKELNKQIKELDKNSSTYDEELGKLLNTQNEVNAKLKIAKKEYASNEKAVISNTKATRAETGSLEQLRGKLSILTAQYDKLSKEQRENAEVGGVQLKRIKELNKEISEIEKTTGRSQRNVGNYTSAWGKVGSLEQLRGKLSILTAQYAKLSKEQRENAEVGGVQLKRIKELNKEISEIEKTTGRSQRNVGNYTSAWGKVGNLFKGGLAILGITAGLQGLANVVKNGIEVINGYSSANSKLAGILGVTKAQTMDLTSQQKELGASTEFSAKQITDAQIELAKYGFTQQEILKSTSGLLNLASASGESLSSSAEVMSSTLRAFNIDASKSENVVDIMAKSFTNSALDLEKFRESMKLVAPISKSANISLETTTGLLGVLANNGLSGSLAGTALKNVLSKLSDANSDLSQSLGYTVKNSEDVVKAFKDIRDRNIDLTEATELTDERSKAAFITMVNGVESVEQLTEAYKNATGSAKALANENLNNLSGDLKILQSAWEGLILTFENGENGLRSFVQGATDLIGVFTDLNVDIHQQSKAMEEQRIEINSLVLRITSLNEGTQERKQLLEELNKLNPTFLKDIDSQSASNEVLTNRLKEVNEQLVNQIIIKQQDEKIEEQARKQAEARIKLTESEIELTKKLSKDKENAEAILKRNMGGDAYLDKQRQILSIYDDQSKSIYERSILISGLTNEQPTLFGDERTVKLASDYANALNELNKVNEESLDIENQKNELLKGLGIDLNDYTSTTDENTNATNENTNATNENNNTISKRNKLAKDYLDIINELSNEDLDFNIDSLAEKFRKGDEYFKNRTKKLQSELDEDINETLRKKEEAKLKEIEFNNEIDKIEKQKENDRRKVVREQAINTAKEITDITIRAVEARGNRRREIELANLDAQLEQGLINQEEFESKKLQIEKDAFNTKKKIDLANVAIALATELVNINTAAAANPLNAVTFGAAGFTQAQVLSGIAIAKSAVNAGVIQAQKFSRGGVLSGANHENGGIPMTVNGKPGYEGEDGEVVINKRSTSMFLPQLDAINRAGGGVSLMSPNMSNLSMFRNGGVMSASNVSNSINAEQVASIVSASIGKIQVVNNATDTANVNGRVNQIKNLSTF